MGRSIPDGVRRLSVRILVVAVHCALLPGASESQSIARSDSAPDVRVEVSDASPRAMVEHFLSLARAGEFGVAASYLDLPDSLRAMADVTARQLKAVLDRHLWIDLERVSPHAAGDTVDGLDAGIDQIGSIRAPGQPPLRVSVVRAPAGDTVSWRFARSTMERIPGLYLALEDRWTLEHLPDALLRPGPFDLLRWQWLAFPLLIAAAVLMGSIASRLTSALFRRVTSRTSTALDDTIIERLHAPMTTALALLAGRLLLPLLNLYPPAEATTNRIVRIGLFVVVFWSLWRLIDVGRRALADSQWAISAASSRSLIPLGSRVAKVIVLAIAAVAVLSMLGYPVASLVAGLGLGGLALALAAQKTVENLFGAFSIGVDQPFREGDFVKVEDFVGTVEGIGLRSTRFRTLDRTLITIPNGRLADMRLESFTVRDRLRLAAILGLVYETTQDQMRDVLAGLERVLREHPKIWPNAVVVRFREFAVSSLDIEVMAWFQTSDWGEFQLIRQVVLLDFMGVVERAGTSFAYPTRTIHLASGTLRTLAETVVSEPGQYRSQ